MSDHILPEVLPNIFRRLAVKDLVSCRRVSKQWRSTIDDPHFIRCQLQRSLSTASSDVAFLQGGVSPLLYWRYDQIESPISQIRFPYQPACQVSLMGSCHGLICFSKLAQPRDFVVINPSTGERHTFGGCRTEELEGRPPHQGAYGFGYDELTSDYKIVRIMRPDYGRYSTEVYSVRGKSFSRKHQLPGGIWVGSKQRMGAFAFGALHWPVTVFNTAFYVILAFDLGSETFRQLRPPYEEEPVCWDLISVGVVDSCLCACALNEDDGLIDIWVMKEYDNFESWIRVYRIQKSVQIDVRFPMYFVPVGSIGSRILLLCEQSRFFWCDPGENRVEAIEVNFEDGNGGSFEAVSYVESLVKIFPK